MFEVYAELPIKNFQQTRDSQLFLTTQKSVICSHVAGKYFEVFLDIVEDAINFHNMGERRVASEFMGHAQMLAVNGSNRRTSTEGLPKQFI